MSSKQETGSSTTDVTEVEVLPERSERRGFLYRGRVGIWAELQDGQIRTQQEARRVLSLGEAAWTELYRSGWRRQLRDGQTLRQCGVVMRGRSDERLSPHPARPCEMGGGAEGLTLTLAPGRGSDFLAITYFLSGLNIYRHWPCIPLAFFGT